MRSPPAISGTEHCDVVVVGAGIGGLCVAHRLRQSGRDVRVLEARDRPGGRLHGFTAGERSVQLGGRWSGPGQEPLKKLAAELGVAIRPLQVFDDAANHLRGDLALEPAVRQIDAMASRVPLDAPWNAPEAAAWDGQTLATFLSSAFGGDRAAALGSILAGFLPEPQDTSLLHALFYLRSNGGFAGILGLDGPAHDSEIFVGGAHLLADRLAALLGTDLMLGAPVHAIVQDTDGVTAIGPAGAVRGRHAIVALPPVLAGRLFYEPAMPPERDYLTQRMPIRGKLAVAVLYATPFWRDRKQTGTLADDNVFAWDEGGTERPACISALVSIRRSRALWSLEPDARRRAVLDHLAAGLGPQATSPVGYHEVYWAAEPWSRGCNSFMTTGAWTAWGHALRAPVGRIHWVGAEYASVFVGQMDGAVRTAEAAANAVGARLAMGE